jgi:hypothetical protein
MGVEHYYYDVAAYICFFMVLNLKRTQLGLNYHNQYNTTDYGRGCGSSAATMRTSVWIKTRGRLTMHRRTWKLATHSGM